MSEQISTVPESATKAKPYVCTTCTRPFARLEHLKRHERSHTKEKPFPCDQAGSLPGCGRRFARRDLLLRHQQKIHLFPNTTKRRRLSTISTLSSVSTARTPPQSQRQLPIDEQRLSQASQLPPPSPQQQQQQQQPMQLQHALPIVPREPLYIMSMPNFEDMSNFENGTVNPSSIYSGPSPTSVQSMSVQQHFADQLTPQLSSSDSDPFCFATEKLLPLDPLAQSELTLGDSCMWQMTADSPASSISSQYSPATSYGSLGSASYLEMAGMDSELFPPDFFVGNANFSQGFPSSSRNVPHPQLYLNSQLEQMTGKGPNMKSGVEEMFQFAGGDQAYCNGFRPSDAPYNSISYVESF